MADVFLAILAAWFVLTGALLFVLLSYWVHEFLHMLRGEDERGQSKPDSDL